MKKTWTLILSILIATTIAIYRKKSPYLVVHKKNSDWKTFVKHSEKEISGHDTTKKELEEAHLSSQKREIAQEKRKTDIDDDEQINFLKANHLPMRGERVLIGDIQKENYQNENTPLLMDNKINLNWKEILGHELLRFQNNDTKVLIKEEYPIIQIQNNKGRYAEQVIVTYHLKDGTINSFRALVDSETGSIIDTWDKTIHENQQTKRIQIPIPLENNSGITTR